MRRTSIAHIVFPRPNLTRPVAEFVWEAARVVGQERGFDLEVLIPVPMLSARRLSSIARELRGKEPWPADLDETLRGLDPRPKLLPYAPIPGYSIESAATAITKELLVRRRAARPALIHGSFLDEGGFAAALAARAIDVRSMVVAHGTDVRMARRSLGATAGRTRRALSALKHADCVLAISRALAADLAVLGRTAPVVYYTVRADEFPLSPRASGPKVALFVGRLTRAKGLDLLLEACTAVKTEDLRVRLVGPTSPDFDVLAEIQRLGLHDRVEVLGELPRNELLRHYQEASCLVLPSRAEGLGIVLIEALLTGRPVIATDAGGKREVVSDRNGRLVPQEDPEALARAMDSVLSETWSAKELRATALPFTWDSMATQLTQATWSALEGRGADAA